MSSVFLDHVTISNNGVGSQWLGDWGAFDYRGTCQNFKLSFFCRSSTRLYRLNKRLILVFFGVLDNCKLDCEGRVSGAS